MSDVVVNSNAVEASTDWGTANRHYLQAEMCRLRLLLQLRALRLRRQWRRELAHVPSGFQSVVISDAEADALLEVDDEAGAGAGAVSPTDDTEQQILDRIDEQQQGIYQARQLFAGGTPPALEIISRLFELGRLEQDILVMCLALEIDSGFERIYAYLQDDIARTYPTAALAQDVFASQAAATDAATELRLTLSAQSPLRRCRLLDTEPSLGPHWRHEPLRLNRRVGDYLLGINRPDEEAATIARPSAGPIHLDNDADELVQQLSRRLCEWDNRRSLPVVQVVTQGGTSPRSLARALCSDLGLNLYTIDQSQLGMPANERQDVYRLLQRESLLLPCGYFIDASHLERNDAGATALLRELLQDVRALLIVVTAEPISLDRSQIVVRVPGTSSHERRQVWRNELKGTEADEGFLSRAVEQFNFDPQQVHSVVTAARETALLRNRESSSPTSADLWRAARDQAGRSMQGLAAKIEPRRSLEDLILPAEQTQQLREIVSQVEHRTRVYEEWGFGAKLSRGKGISALFSGPSGTGKTMAAEVLAGLLDLDLYRIDLAGVVSKYIGETEKNLRRVFDVAEESGAILFFDEADALFGKRSEVRDSHDRFANIEINYLLQRMEDYRGLAILATNRKSLLDPAFLRRLRFLVEFPVPSPADRVRIWKAVFPPQAKVDALDYQFLGRLEIAGGNIINIALNAAFRASREGCGVGMQHVLAAARQEYDKIEKMVLESEFGRYYAAVRR